MMYLSEIEVGEMYRLNEDNESPYPTGSLVEVLSVNEDGDSLIKVRIPGSDGFEWVEAWELDEVTSPTEKLQERKQTLKDILKQCILDEEIQIESTSRGTVQISIDGELLIES